jgi:hypothetical protein
VGWRLVLGRKLGWALTDDGTGPSLDMKACNRSTILEDMQGEDVWCSGYASMVTTSRNIPRKWQDGILEGNGVVRYLLR